MGYYLNANRRRVTLSDPTTMLFTFAACILCWVTGYIFSVGFPISESDVVLHLWGGVSKSLSNKAIVYIIGLLLFILTAYIMQRISDIEMFIHERTRLPFMIFIILISTNAELIPIGGATIVLLCFVAMIYQLFNSYQDPEAVGVLFNAGVFLGDRKSVV